MKEKLLPFHIALLIFMTQSGSHMLYLPRMLADHFGYNGWVVLIAFWIVSSINIFFIGRVAKAAKGRSVFELMEERLPKILYIPLYALFIGVWALYGCLAAKHFVLVYQMLIFQTMPPTVFKLFVDLLAFLLIIQGIHVIAKAASLFFLLHAWMYLLLLPLWKDFSFARMTPFLFGETPDWITASLLIYPVFGGYELALLLLPSTEKTGKWVRAVWYGHTCTFLWILVGSLFCFGAFSLEQLKHLEYPFVNLVAKLNYSFIERMDNLFFSLYLFPALTFLVMYTWAAKEVVQRLLPKAKSVWITASLLVAGWIVTLIPKYIDVVLEWTRKTALFIMFIELALPAGLIILFLWKRRVSHAEG